MRARQLLCIIGIAALAVYMLGCAAPTQQTRTNMSTRGADAARPSIAGGRGSTAQAQPAAQAAATEVDYFGWKAFKLENGLVTLIAVPDIGGRVMEYKLGGHQFLWVNQAHRGKLPEAPRTEADRAWLNFGGYKSWPGPRNDWGGPPDPLGSQLDAGRWQGKIVTKSGQTATIEMTSPSDANVTGLQITRQVHLRANSTRATIVETYQNVSNRPIICSARGVTQVIGALEADGRPSRDAKVYLPLKQESAHSDGYVLLSGNDATQWRTVAGGKILETSYAGQAARIGADSDGGWITYTDNLHGVTFANTFSVTPDARYPENGSTVQVAPSAAGTPYMDIEVLSPLKALAPGERFSFTHHWSAAKVAGPIIKVTDVGAVRTHPTAARKGDKIVVTGEIGVFAPGEVVLELVNKDGHKIGASQPVKATPGSNVSLNVTVTPPQGATSAIVALSANGSRLGSIAQVPLVSGLARTSGGGRG